MKVACWIAESAKAMRPREPFAYWLGLSLPLKRVFWAICEPARHPHKKHPATGTIDERDWLRGRTVNSGPIRAPPPETAGKKGHFLTLTNNKPAKCDDLVVSCSSSFLSSSTNNTYTSIPVSIPIAPVNPSSVIYNFFCRLLLIAPSSLQPHHTLDIQIALFTSQCILLASTTSQTLQ